MEENILCYICYDPETKNNSYLKAPPPCECKGSIVIHKHCFDQVIKKSRICSICKTKYKLEYLPNRDGLELITEVSINGDITEYTIDKEGDIQGEHTIKKQTGELIARSMYKNGLLDGEYKTWYSNGQLECVCYCERNKINGIYKAWYENGVMMEETEYKNGLKDGICSKWDKEGKLIMALNYVNGEMTSEDFEDNL
jgi:antitoxin component YwqK of YwqJK toxin-antitoxin module